MTSNVEFFIMLCEAIIMIVATFGGVAILYAFLTRNRNDMWERITKTPDDVKEVKDE